MTHDNPAPEGLLHIPSPRVDPYLETLELLHGHLTKAAKAGDADEVMRMTRAIEAVQELDTQ